MKKQFIYIAFIATSCLFSSFNSMAQSTKLYLGLTGGLSAPFGNFAKTDYADNTSGYASTGANIGVTGTYFLDKHWGINALASYHAYGFKGTQNLANGFKDAFDIDSSTVSIKGNNYSLNFLIGPYYSLPVTKKLSLDFRVLVGLTNAHLAGNEVFIEDQADGTFTQSTSSATAFAYQVGAAARYDLSKHFGVMLNVDYFSSKPNFTINNTNRANEAGRYINAYNQPIQGINTNLTLVYMLKK